MDPINQTNENAGGKGSLIGAIIVVIILIIGAIYLLSGRTEAPVLPESGENGNIPSGQSPVDETGTSDLEDAAASIDVDILDQDAAALEGAVNQ